MTTTEIGLVIYRLRVKHSLNNKQLGQHFGFKPEYIGLMEAGQRVPRWVLDKFCGYLGLEWFRFFTSSGLPLKILQQKEAPK